MFQNELNTQISRRSFLKAGSAAALTLGAVGAAGSLSACGGSSTSNSNSASNTNATKEEPFMSEGKGQHLVCAKTGKLIKVAPAILAEQLGYFEAEGCDVEFQFIALADAMASMSVNKLDIDLFGIIPACSYVSQGVPVYVFGGTILNGSEIIGTKNFTKTLTKAEDFKGLNIGCGREESGQIILKNFLLDAGLNVDCGDGKWDTSKTADVTFVYIDNMTAALEGLRSGQNDLYIANNAMGYTYSTEYDDIKVVAIPADITGSYPCCRQNCSEEAYKKKYLSLVDFEIAMIRGYAYYKDEANKQDVIKRLVDYSAQKEDYVEAAMYGKGDYRNVMDLTPDPHTKECVGFYKAMENTGAISKGTADFTDYAVSSIYKKALDTLVEREPNNAIYKKLAEDYNKYN